MWTWADECPDPDWDNKCRNTVDRFHTLDSTTLQYTGAIQYIKYGIGASEGPVCKDVVSFQGLADNGNEIETDLRAEQFEFFVKFDYPKPAFAWEQVGVLGLAPNDESAGPLFIEHLYKQQ